MNEKDRSRIEERLIEERARVARALERVDEAGRISTEDDGELTQYDNHPADDGTDTYEQEQAMALLGRDGEMLTAIDHALRVLYREPETFGRCENCGRDLSVERLDLVPWARMCVECAAATENSA